MSVGILIKWSDLEIHPLIVTTKGIVKNKKKDLSNRLGILPYPELKDVEDILKPAKVVLRKTTPSGKPKYWIIAEQNDFLAVKNTYPTGITARDPKTSKAVVGKIYPCLLMDNPADARRVLTDNCRDLKTKDIGETIENHAALFPAGVVANYREFRLRITEPLAKTFGGIPKSYTRIGLNIIGVRARDYKTTDLPQLQRIQINKCTVFIKFVIDTNKVIQVVSPGFQIKEVKQLDAALRYFKKIMDAGSLSQYYAHIQGLANSANSNVKAALFVGNCKESLKLDTPSLEKYLIAEGIL